MDEVNKLCSDIRTTIDETEKQIKPLNSFHSDTVQYESQSVC